MQKRKCSQCGKGFTINDSEISFYKKKNLALPKRCKECRELNKAKRKQESAIVEEKVEESKPEIQVESSNNLNKKKQFKKQGGILGILIFLVVVIAGIFYNTSGGEQDPGIPKDTSSKASVEQGSKEQESAKYVFRNDQLLKDHFEKHGDEFEFETMQEYAEGANKVIHTPGVLHKVEKEDADDIYYLEATNEFVVVSTDGYLRTYFKPDGGMKYYESK